MSTESIAEPDLDDPILALEDLRRELSLVRLAVEGLTAARDRTPDYSPTLARMSQTLDGAAAAFEMIKGSAAIQLTPAVLTIEIIKAGTTARTEDVRVIREAGNALATATGRIDGIVERGQAAERQRERVIWAGTVGIVFGILIWSILPGAIARSLPASWHVPEWMAARTMGMELQPAGERIIATAHRMAR